MIAADAKRRARHVTRSKESTENKLQSFRILNFMQRSIRCASPVATRRNSAFYHGEKRAEEKQKGHK